MSNGAKLSLLLISLTILSMAALMSGLIKSKHWLITDIDINAQFKRVNSEQVRIVVAAHPQRSFFKMNADKIRNQLMQIPWVQQVSVNKKWPNNIKITVIEHQAVAVWNQNKLLNENGEIFKVDSIDDLDALPQINGRDSQSQPIWEQYKRFNEIVKNTGLDINSTTVSNRGGWNLFLSNGINIKLGSYQMDSKLVRLADTWSKLLNQSEGLPEYIDLRYTNGYVVKWHKVKTNNILSNTPNSTLGLLEETENNNG